MTSLLDRWLPFRTEDSRVRCRLFCFPHAGGNAQFYRPWRDLTPPELDFCPVELPGRATRLDEPAYTDMAAMIAAVANGLTGALNVPFAFFGHSIGACIAFEAARKIHSADGRYARHLFVSARTAPNTFHYPKADRGFSDAELLRILRAYGGTSNAVISNRELMAAILPTLRADILLADSYRVDQKAVVTCPITGFGGSDDAVGFQSLETWSRFTNAGFRHRTFRGGHFYFLDDPTALVREIAQDLCISPDNGRGRRAPDAKSSPSSL